MVFDPDSDPGLAGQVPKDNSPSNLSVKLREITTIGADIHRLVELPIANDTAIRR